ncbi:DUF3237 domain-containing protein [Paraburkholderia sediminicola]|uniref:DUF3237 domain-containing protein n=1 Tax=Paraburkholderia sediminicola TaxID=458836 RepID=UPI000E76226E
MTEPLQLDNSVQPTKLASMLPRFEYLMQARVLAAPALRMGNSNGMGERIMMPILGGDFEGPRLRGRIVPGGGDWPLIRPDGVGQTDARYTLETDDGVFINIRNTGYRHGPAEAMKTLNSYHGVADPESYYLRVWTAFEAPVGKYDWLARHVFFGIAERHPKVLFLRYYMLL